VVVPLRNHFRRVDPPPYTCVYGYALSRFVQICLSATVAKQPARTRRENTAIRAAVVVWHAHLAFAFREKVRREHRPRLGRRRGALSWLKVVVHRFDVYNNRGRALGRTPTTTTLTLFHSAFCLRLYVLCGVGGLYSYTTSLPNDDVDRFQAGAICRLGIFTYVSRKRRGQCRPRLLPRLAMWTH